jgi:uncharacterized protein with NRDE domain
MCLIVFAHAMHPKYRLVVAANRDEFYSRPTEAAHFWDGTQTLLAGRDLSAGGTWLGVTRSGRFAAVTNHRDPLRERPTALSRGTLTTGFLQGSDPPLAYLEHIARVGSAYGGFNLIVGDGRELGYYSNRDEIARRLDPGVYGLSNDALDTNWLKVERGKVGLEAILSDEVISPEDLLDLLSDATSAPDDRLPDTGVGIEWERVLSPVFIRTEAYGTRSSTALLIDVDGEVTFVERVYEPGRAPSTQSFRFRAEPRLLS